MTKSLQMISVSYFQLQIQLFYLVTYVVQAMSVQILQKRILKSEHLQKTMRLDLKLDVTTGLRTVLQHVAESHKSCCRETEKV